MDKSITTSNGKKWPTKHIKYSRAIANQIVQLVADGHHIEEICDKILPDTTPASRTVYRWKLDPKKKDFATALGEAYGIMMMGKMARMDYLAKTPLETLYPGLPFDMQKEARKSEIDILKFELKELRPIITRMFDKEEVLKVKHSGIPTQLAPIIQVLNYADQVAIPIARPAIQHAVAKDLPCADSSVAAALVEIK